jgi:hypothetical protein
MKWPSNVRCVYQRALGALSYKQSMGFIQIAHPTIEMYDEEYDEQHTFILPVDFKFDRSLYYIRTAICTHCEHIMLKGLFQHNEYGQIIRDGAAMQFYRLV